MDNGEPQPRYFIDLNWYEKEERSFSEIAFHRLCPSSQKEVPRSEAALFQTIAKCCSRRNDFITSKSPLLEMIFRLFLANHNQPLDLEQIQQQLLTWIKDASIRDLSLPKLKRIIDNDHCYGLAPAPQITEPSASPESL